MTPVWFDAYSVFAFVSTGNIQWEGRREDLESEVSTEFCFNECSNATSQVCICCRQAVWNSMLEDNTEGTYHFMLVLVRLILHRLKLVTCASPSSL